jgi:PAS domain S-box-containing protein
VKTPGNRERREALCSRRKIEKRMLFQGAGDSPEFNFRIPPDLLNQVRFRALLQSLCTFVWVASPDGDITFPQESMERYTGYGFARQRGNGWLEAVHPDDRASVAAAWREAVVARSWYEIEYRCWHGGSGTWRRCRTRGVPILNPEGEVVEWFGAVTDLDGVVHTSSAALGSLP